MATPAPRFNRKTKKSRRFMGKEFMGKKQPAAPAPRPRAAYMTMSTPPAPKKGARIPEGTRIPEDSKFSGKVPPKLPGPIPQPRKELPMPPGIAKKMQGLKSARTLAPGRSFRPASAATPGLMNKPAPAPASKGMSKWERLNQRGRQVAKGRR